MSRASSGGQIRLALAVALTTWLTLIAWNGFIEIPGRYLNPLIPGMLLVAAAGIGARVLRLPAVVVIAGQLLVVLLYGNLLWGTRNLPTPDSLRTAVQAFAHAVEAARQYAAPIPVEGGVPSVVPLLVLGGLACHVIVDMLAVTFGRAPVAGLPLLTIYSLPVSVLDRSVSWVVFVLAAIGFLLVLQIQESDRVGRWGRELGSRNEGELSGFNVRAGHQGTAAVGATAISLAVVLPLLIPTLNLDVLDGAGDGPGRGGDREVSITNPIANLKQDLELGPDVPLLQVQAPKPPTYVRLTVLPVFTGLTWHPGSRVFPEDQPADGPLPYPTGLSRDVPVEEEDWELSVSGNLESLWLPTARFTREIFAGDDWRYDAASLDIHSREDDILSDGVDYTLTSMKPQYNDDDLASASPPPFQVLDTYTTLPEDFPASVTDLAFDVTRGLDNDFHKAVALQQFFQREFRYSTNGQEGNGTNELVRFLDPANRVGYCEQFAASMAVMARALDIPARVAVGFLEPAHVVGQDDLWEFSSRDMHAWPEIYLDGYGWVMFEPTPTRHTGSVPAYTRDALPGANPSGGPTTATPTTQPTQNRPTAEPEPSANENADDNKSGQGGVPWVPILGGGGLLLLLAALTLVPRAVRRRLTARRWGTTTNPAETAWLELRDAAVDLGVPWPHGRSPRAGAAMLALHFAAPLGPDSPERPARGPETNPEATTAVGEIVRALELSRYAPPEDVVAASADLQAATDRCAEALRSGVNKRARRRAEWFPRSVLNRAALTERATILPSRQTQGVVDSLR